MGKRKVLDERAMQLAETLIPALAEYALRRARDRALTLGGTVLEAIDGKLVETSVDASQRFIANLPPATPIRPGVSAFGRAAIDPTLTAEVGLLAS